MKRIFLAAMLAASLPALHGCAAVVIGGAATGAMVADDRRKTGVYLEDQEIELRAAERLRVAFPGKGVSVGVVSYNHHVLMYGQAQDEADRAKAEGIIKTIPNVDRVYNEVAISGVTSSTSDVNDTAITAKVKARLLDSKKVSFNHVKVVTEAAVVYLMGLVTREEGDAAAQIAATTSGVVKVVKLFEYLN